MLEITHGGAAKCPKSSDTQISLFSTKSSHHTSLEYEGSYVLCFGGYHKTPYDHHPRLKLKEVILELIMVLFV